MKISCGICSLALIASLGLGAGCSQKAAAPVQVQYYPACHEPLAYLHQRSSGAGRAIAGSAMQGGVLSGIASAIIGAIAGGINGTGVAVSVGVGSALGGTMGALHSKNAQQREDNRHLAAYLEQIDGNIEGLDIVSAAATVSRQCYNREFQKLLASMKDKSITLQAAQSRFREIETGERESAQLLKQPCNAAELQAEFEVAARGE